MPILHIVSVYFYGQHHLAVAVENAHGVGPVTAHLPGTPGPQAPPGILLVRLRSWCAAEGWPSVPAPASSLHDLEP